MNISKKMFPVVFISVMHVFCLSMDRQLAIIPKEILAKEISQFSDLPTQRNIRATCRLARDSITIDEIESARSVLRGDIGFILVHPRGYSNEEFAPVWQKNYRNLERAFAFVDTQEGCLFKRQAAKRWMLEQSVCPGRYGLKHQYTENLLKPAIIRGVESGNDSFAVALIEANPHGFAGGSDVKPGSLYYNPEVPELINCLTIPEKQKYIDLCAKQTKMPASRGNKMCVIS